MIPQHRLNSLASYITRKAISGALAVLEGAPHLKVEAPLVQIGAVLSTLGMGDMFAMCWRGQILLEAALAAKNGEEYIPSDAEWSFAQSLYLEDSEPLHLTMDDLEHMQALLADRARQLRKAGPKYDLAADRNLACSVRLEMILKHLAVIEQQRLIITPSDYMESP